jgi:putative ABC transport system ATP-binding protein
MLKTNNLQYAHDTKQTLFFPDIHCNKGEQQLILGQSGGGKTTLLHLLGGLLKPKNGTIIIGETDITQLSGAKLDAFRGKNIGIVFQQPHFIRSLSVGENLLLTQKLAGIKMDKSFVLSLLTTLNVAHKFYKPTTELSQGEQQRVAIARALVTRPMLILADEPTSALDDVHTQEVAHLLTRQAAEVDACLMLVTHDNRLTTIFPKHIKIGKDAIYRV